jgi:hypothetical protein
VVGLPNGEPDPRYVTHHVWPAAVRSRQNDRTASCQLEHAPVTALCDSCRCRPRYGRQVCGANGAAGALRPVRSLFKPCIAAASSTASQRCRPFRFRTLTAESFLACAITRSRPREATGDTRTRRLSAGPNSPPLALFRRAPPPPRLVPPLILPCVSQSSTTMPSISTYSPVYRRPSMAPNSSPFGRSPLAPGGPEARTSRSGRNATPNAGRLDSPLCTPIGSVLQTPWHYLQG